MSNQINGLAYRETTPLEKLLTSCINVAIVFPFLLPCFFLALPVFYLKLIFVALFLLENLLAISFNNYRLPGMVIQNTHWKQHYALAQQLTHAVLYTLSFSTALFWIAFPGDLLLFNILALQLPCVLLTKATLHGLLSGTMVDVKIRHKT